MPNEIIIMIIMIGPTFLTLLCPYIPAMDQLYRHSQQFSVENFSNSFTTKQIFPTILLCVFSTTL